MSTSLEQFQELIQKVRAEVGKVIIGQHAAIDQALIVILARQHALLEGVPGIAKTLLTRTLGYVLGCPFGRIQFTPDLMPADITGTNVFNLQTERIHAGARPGVHHISSGRRNQPRTGKNTIRLIASDAGTHSQH